MRTDIGGCPKRAVVFGAGKMACGLLGELLYKAGFETFFVARSCNIASINRERGYFVGLAGGEPRQMRVRNCKAFAIAEPDAIVEAVAMADIVFTAVGIDNIPAIAPVVTEGLSRRIDHARPPSRRLPSASQRAPSWLYVSAILLREYSWRQEASRKVEYSLAYSWPGQVCINSAGVGNFTQHGGALYS